MRGSHATCSQDLPGPLRSGRSKKAYRIIPLLQSMQSDLAVWESKQAGLQPGHSFLFHDF